MLQLSVKQVELEGAKEELELARADLKDTAGLAKDEMVQKAFEVSAVINSLMYNILEPLDKEPQFNQLLDKKNP